MKSNKKNKIFIDSNVIIGDTCYRYQVIKSRKQCFTRALSNLYTKGDLDLYIADFTLANYIAKFQKKLKKEDLVKEVRRLMSKCNLVTLSETDVETAISDFVNRKRTDDFEDQIQVILAKKMDCSYIITENTKDFTGFGSNFSVHPDNCSSLFYTGMKK